MKKIILFLLSSVIFLSLSGCSVPEAGTSQHMIEADLSDMPDMPDFDASDVIRTSEFCSEDGAYTLKIQLHAFFDYSILDENMYSGVYDDGSDEWTEEDMAAFEAQWNEFYEKLEETAEYYYVFYWMEEDGITEPVCYIKTENNQVFSSEGEYGYIQEQEPHPYTYSDTYEIHWLGDCAEVNFLESEQNWRNISVPYPDRTVYTQTAEWEYSNEKKPEVTKAILTADCYGKLQNKARAEDVYDIYVFPSSTVGLIGVPVKLSYLESVENTELTLCYEEDELRGVPESSIIVMYCYEDYNFLEELPRAIFNSEENTVTIPDAIPGIYLLVDVYEWDTRWNEKNPRGAYSVDKSDYESNWERECGTGDIMEIADIEWVKESNGEFHVQTPEQLAGVVYYTNVLAEYYETVVIYLENDIDLSGYEWAPMGWRDDGTNQFIIYGMGHTISNMTIHLPEQREVGFIGYANQLNVYDLTFENASITGKSFAGVLCGVAYTTNVIENVTVSGSIEADSFCGSMIGDESGGIGYKNCQANVIVNGVEFPYFSDEQRQQAELEPYVEETFHIAVDENYCITRDEHEGYESLGWEVFIDDMPVLSRNAENETVFNTRDNAAVGVRAGCTYKIYLTAYMYGTYIRVSNILEYTVPENYVVSSEKKAQ
ncbi:MAG: hypothetical protein ACI4JQ_09480 [Ruminococcus sp.]